MPTPLLLSLGLPFITQVIAEALEKIDSPVAKTAASALSKVQDAIAGGSITPEQMIEANRHAEAMAALQSEEAKAAYEQVNESLRAEIASSDSYVRHMRPTFGYIIAVTWGAQMMAVAYVIIFDTAQANAVINAMQSMGTLWTVGLSVLGIYVYKRSEEKKVLPLSTPTVQSRPPGLAPGSSDKSQFNE